MTSILASFAVNLAWYSPMAITIVHVAGVQILSVVVERLQRPQRSPKMSVLPGTERR